MPDRAKCISLNGAPSQYDRYLGLEDDGVRVDDRSESQLLAFSVEFGRLLEFYNLQNKPDGDWSGFFLSDPTIALASVVALDLGRLQTSFDELEKAVLGNANGQRKSAALATCFRWLLDLARQFDDWLSGTERLLHSHSARMFSTEVRHLVTQELGPAIRRLRRHSEESPAKDALTDSPLSFSGFLPVWGLNDAVPRIEGGQQLQEELGYGELAVVLRACFWAMLAGAQRLREYALRHMVDTLTESDHQPPAALYIAFVHLFRIAQRTVNEVTPRFARFYYLDVLRSSSSGSQAETVYLTAAVANDFAGHAATITRGTQFSSAADHVAPSVVYSARHDMPVSAATLQVVRTLRVASGALCEGVPSAPVPTRIIAAEIDVDLMNLEAAGKTPNSSPLPWPTFGATSSGASAVSVASPAIMGFALASQYFMLTGGARDVTVTFSLAAFSPELTSALDELAAASGLTQAATFEAILSGAFDISLSTTSGWFAVSSYTVEYTPVSADVPIALFSLKWSLSPSAPQLVAFGLPPDDAPPDTAGSDTANPAPLVPTARFCLRQTPLALPVAQGNGGVSTYPLSTLRLVEIASMRIGTTTQNLTELEVQNTNGPVDTSSPFPFFGAVPVVGSYLRLSNPELFVKVPASLTLAIEWYALPAGKRGFEGYYQDYKRDANGRRRANLFNNTTFRCQIDITKPGLWELPCPPAPLYLFTTVDGTTCSAEPTALGQVCPVSTFDKLTIEPETAPDFYDPADTALQVTLTAPDYGFGNLLYAPNVLNAVIDDLPPPAGTTSETTSSDTTAVSTRALRTAVDSQASLFSAATGKSSGLLGASSWFSRWGQKKDRSNLTAAVQKWQGNVVSAVRTFLEQNLIPLSGAAAAQVQGIFASVPAGTTPSQQAQALDAALQSADPPLPPAAAGVVSIASVVLKGVASADQTLQKCEAQTDSEYKACVQTGLASLQEELDHALDSLPDDTAGKLQYPNPPWLPQAKSVSIGYTANCSVTPAGTADGSFYYLVPFGGYQAPIGGLDSVPLLPFPDYSGQLILGVASLQIPQTLNILFQMVAGGHRNPPAIFWEYLTRTWTRFQDSEEPADTTNGLQQTGIVSLSVPVAGDDPQTIAPSGLRWLRAVVSPDGTLVAPELFPETTGVYLNPIVADRVGGNSDDPSQRTPAHTIMKPAEKLHGIGDINQPSGSFGGRAQENYDQLRVRQAERLRHKDRAVLSWDYERLVLQAFPDIWKVMALPATRAIEPGTAPVSREPGCVLVMVVAGPPAATKDTTKPVATAETLERITQFLASRASVFAKIRVVNPNYVAIRVDATVSFVPAEDSGTGLDSLNSDLVQYLSPWFYDEARAQKSGDYASQDAIIQFIVTRSYIAALNDIRFDYDGTWAPGWCFYTSAPKHQLRQNTPMRNPAVHSSRNG